MRLYNVYRRAVRYEQWRGLSDVSPLGKRALSKTVFLPKTQFQRLVKQKDRVQLDSELRQKMGPLKELYDWQLHDSSRAHLPVFKLLDGPPYANGRVHVGHAVNKVLKDFVTRYKMSTGHRVLFRPGWDCHGLPIELQVERDGDISSEPVQRRLQAQTLATAAVHDQMNSFRHWSVLADWDHAYLTMDRHYEGCQLRLFWQLYERSLIYRAFMPVYWSVSSKTALAESELSYNATHESTAVYYRFLMINFLLDAVAGHLATTGHHFEVFALVWTTTPWTLPLNNAICFDPNAQYLLVEFTKDSKNPKRKLHIISEDTFSNFSSSIEQPLSVHGRFSGSALTDCFYVHCLWRSKALPFLSAGHVTSDAGTGLVHTAFAHGFDDYAVATEYKREVQCFVDEEGRYCRELGHDLWNKEVLGEGQMAVLRVLKKNVLHRHSYSHSYPYDWRTDQPVIIRASAQWFIDVTKVAQRAIDLVNESVTITTGGCGKDIDRRNALTSLLSGRPSWCISRQRSWGVPLPVFYKEDGQSVVTEHIIRHLASLFDQHGSDCWWTMTVDHLLTSQVKEASGLSVEEPLTKGMDIMDVWLDSGAV